MIDRASFFPYHFYQRFFTIILIALTFAVLGSTIIDRIGPTRAASGELFSSIWYSKEVDATYSLAWGDLDNDGDLDLAVGNDGSFVRVYLNTNGILETQASWHSNLTSYTYSVAWGDMDKDGDLDLAVGNILGANHVYRNNAGTLTQNPVWYSTEQDNTVSLEWGDIDGDGDLDLAVGNTNAPNRVYLNSNGNLTTAASWSSNEVDNTHDVAWGDYDNDGDLDLAVGNWGQVNRLYRNDGGVLTSSGVWSSLESDDSSSIAWGDVDGDNDLDLAVGNYNTTQPARLYSNDNGALKKQAAWSSTEMALTTGIAWGDADGDQDLDLLVSNRTAPNRLYRNDAGSLIPQAAWSAIEAESTWSLAWGDMNGDGLLDLAFGNVDKPIHVYLNNNGLLMSSPGWVSNFYTEYRSLAWGDFDKDGDLDLVAGLSDLEYGSPNQIFRNDNGVLTKSPVWTSLEADETRSVAWGDVDNDGDLDLAVGNAPIWTGNQYAGGYNRVYINNQGILNTSATWSSVEADRTYAISWGDYDNDGDLDLVAGNFGQPIRIYQNYGSGLGSSAIWSSSKVEFTNSIAWGDLDQDGDLDLAVGNQPLWNGNQYVGGFNEVYINNQGVLNALPSWSSIDNDYTTQVLWGDMDQDGDLDLVAANKWAPNRVYENISGVLNPDPIWSSANVEKALSAALSDVDGDGDLDLVVGNEGGFSRLYRNEQGELTPYSVWSSTYYGAMSLAWGDVDNDGDLDLATGDSLSCEVYLNYRDGKKSLKPVPNIKINPIGLDADFFATSQRINSATVAVSYKLYHAKNLPVRKIYAYFSLDGGDHWFTARSTPETITTNLSTSATGISHIFVWDLFQSGIMGQSDQVVFRLVAIPALSPLPNQSADSFLFSSYSTNTYPFRIR